MEAFPCPLELTVASALLLLSTTPPPLSPPDSVKKISISESLGFSDSKSCSSSVICDDGSSEETRSHRIRFVAVVSRFHEMKLKHVVRKSRSKNFRSSGHLKILSGKAAKVPSRSASETTEASSSLSSSGSSVISSARTCNNVTRMGKREALACDLKRKQIGSALLHHRAEAILKVLSDGCASELKIRQLLGDSPDTSKALRMLLKLDEVKRSGAGGRNDPYIYKVTQITILYSILFNAMHIYLNEKYNCNTLLLLIHVDLTTKKTELRYFGRSVQIA
ncbi:uncharacterized protein LOC132288907 [Cornus florida]|uniref:uncharacterized protein LOC132288907 n=1 Tax=Cornus florida TaxID=4283 RepID=UPI0028986863|nr:uncharacterized protein LOC132288907 [Cornus florida]